jgi:cytochrome c oxidase cbb3-type subunit 1
MSAISQDLSQEDVQLRSAIDRSLRHPVMFFFTSGAAWLAVSLLLGLLSSIKVHSPEFASGWPFLTYGRVFPAHMSAMVYGWACQAGFGTLIWLMARLSRQECKHVGVILTAGHLWNLAVAVGIVSILAGHGTGKPWLDFPSFVWPGMILSYAAITVWSIVQFRCRPAGHVYISQWFLLGALIWFPWVFLTGNVVVHHFGGSPLMAVAVNAWYRSALVLLYFVPVGVAAAYYLAPKVSGRPVYSYSLGIMGFWTLAVVGPWAGMQKLAGVPIPNSLVSIGAAALVLFAVPAITVAVNILRTAGSRNEVVTHSPSLHFTMAGISGLLILGLLGVVMSLEDPLRFTQFSMAGYGYEMLALYGFFSMCMFGAIYFIVPRLTRREWLSRRLIRMHFWFSVYGSAFIVLFAIIGGLFQGIGQEDYLQPWIDAASRTYGYAVGTTMAWVFVLVSNFFFFIHLGLMWLRLGRRSAHPTLLHSHHPDSPHGPEGDVEEILAGRA